MIISPEWYSTTKTRRISTYSHSILAALKVGRYFSCLYLKESVKCFVRLTANW
jgi:hypothetical protein